MFLFSFFVVFFFVFWRVQCTLESFMRILGKTDHISSVPWIAGLPLTADKLSESGREQMWPTPNWLHQHSFCVLILFSCRSVLSFLRKSTLLSPLHIKDKHNNIHHCFEVDLSMCFAHDRYLKAFSIFQWMLPSVPVQTFSNHLKCIPVEYQAFMPILFLSHVIWAIYECWRVWSNKWDRICLHSYAMRLLRNWEWKVNVSYVIKKTEIEDYFLQN